MGKERDERERGGERGLSAERVDSESGETGEKEGIEWGERVKKVGRERGERVGSNCGMSGKGEWVS